MVIDIISIHVPVGSDVDSEALKNQLELSIQQVQIKPYEKVENISVKLAFEDKKGKASNYDELQRVAIFKFHLSSDSEKASKALITQIISKLEMQLSPIPHTSPVAPEGRIVSIVDYSGIEGVIGTRIGKGEYAIAYGMPPTSEDRKFSGVIKLPTEDVIDSALANEESKRGFTSHILTKREARKAMDLLMSNQARDQRVATKMGKQNAAQVTGLQSLEVPVYLDGAPTKQSSMDCNIPIWNYIGTDFNSGYETTIEEIRLILDILGEARMYVGDIIAIGNIKVNEAGSAVLIDCGQATGGYDTDSEDTAMFHDDNPFSLADKYLEWLTDEPFRYFKTAAALLNRAIITGKNLDNTLNEPTDTIFWQAVKHVLGLTNNTSIKDVIKSFIITSNAAGVTQTDYINHFVRSIVIDIEYKRAMLLARTLKKESTLEFIANMVGEDEYDENNIKLEFIRVIDDKKVREMLLNYSIRDERSEISYWSSKWCAGKYEKYGLLDICLILQEIQKDQYSSIAVGKAFSVRQVIPLEKKLGDRMHWHASKVKPLASIDSNIRQWRIHHKKEILGHHNSFFSRRENLSQGPIVSVNNPVEKDPFILFSPRASEQGPQDTFDLFSPRPHRQLMEIEERPVNNQMQQDLSSLLSPRPNKIDLNREEDKVSACICS